MRGVVEVVTCIIRHYRKMIGVCGSNDVKGGGFV